MGGLLILISMVAGTVAFISLIRPLPRFWLPTRKRAALVWIASFVLFATGGSLLPVPTPGTQSEELAQREVTTNTEVAVEAPAGRAACTAAMQAAAAERSVDLAQPLLVRTAYECPTVDIWLATLRTHPGAMGLNERAQIGELSIQAMCSTSDTELRDSPMCQDAYTRGMAKPAWEYWKQYSAEAMHPDRAFTNGSGTCTAV